MSLVLKDLKIERWGYEWAQPKSGAKKGEHWGSITFDDQQKEVTFILSHEHCAKIFAVCADALIATATEAATALVIEAKAQQATLIGVAK